MKKPILFAAFMVWWAMLSLAQVSTHYNFQNAAGVYTPLTSGPITSLDVNQNHHIPIGFEFTYMGQTFDSIWVSPKGYAWFSSTNGNSVTTEFPLSDAGFAAQGVISPLGGRLRPREDGSIGVLAYGLRGATNNRYLAIEWRNFTRGLAVTGVNTGDTVTFQLRLYKFNNQIEFHYGTCRLNGAGINEFFQVGIRTNDVQDYMIRTGGWANSQAAASNMAPQALSATSNFTYGSIYRFNTTTYDSSSIRVLEANGGEYWSGGDSRYIRWEGKGIQRIDISFSIDSGRTYTNIVSGAPGMGSQFLWNVPFGINSNNCFIRIENTLNYAILDSSDAPFSINGTAPIPFLQLTAPNGGEVLTAGGSTLIDWNSSGVSNINIDYQIGTGGNWTSIVANTPNLNGYTWIIPDGLITDSLRIRVSNSNTPAMADISAGYVRVQASLNTEEPENILVNAYPNPTSNTLYLQSNQLFKGTVRIIDLSGKTIWERTSNDLPHKIDMSLFKPGIYILSLTNQLSGNVQHLRVVKQ